MIHVRDGGREYDEMHVDGGTTTPFFVAPEISQLDASRTLQLNGGRIYVLVNGALSAVPVTTPGRSLAVISRGFAASLMHSSRKTVELAAEFARRYSLDLEFSSIPTTYPYRGALAFEPEELKKLFEFGVRCAESGMLWTQLDVVAEQREKALAGPSSTPTCPAPPDTLGSRVAAARAQ